MNIIRISEHTCDQTERALFNNWPILSQMSYFLFHLFFNDSEKYSKFTVENVEGKEEKKNSRKQRTMEEQEKDFSSTWHALCTLPKKET